MGVAVILPVVVLRTGNLLTNPDTELTQAPRTQG